MKLEYFPETDTLYISLLDEQSVESEEIADDVVVDYAEDGRAIGFEIEHASTKVDLSKLETSLVPVA
jgi:uncharacterized protein YuzE